MMPEQHRETAAKMIEARELSNRVELATYHATMAVAEALLQMDICGHGTRGFCKDCVVKMLRDNQPWTVEVRERS